MWQSFSIQLRVKSLLLSEMVRKKLTSYWPSTRAILGNTGTNLWQYRPFCTWSIQKWPRANIPQYGSSKLGVYVVYYMVFRPWICQLQKKKFFYTKNEPKILTKCDKILTKKEPIDLRTIVPFNTITYKLKCIPRKTYM